MDSKKEPLRDKIDKSFLRGKEILSLLGFYFLFIPGSWTYFIQSESIYWKKRKEFFKNNFPETNS